MKRIFYFENFISQRCTKKAQRCTKGINKRMICFGIYFFEFAIAIEIVI